MEEAVEVLSRVIAAQPAVAEARALLGRCIAILNSEAQARRTRVRQRAAAAQLGGAMAAGQDPLKDERGVQRCFLQTTQCNAPVGLVTKHAA